MPSPQAQQRRHQRSAARFYAVQALFQMEAQRTALDEVLREFERYRIGAEIEGERYREADRGYFSELVTAAVDQQAAIDQLTDRALVAKWPIDRIDPTLRAMFRTGGGELISAQTPPRVVITEYVEIAKAFFPEGREPRFVNAVLDHMAREVQPQAFA